MCINPSLALACRFTWLLLAHLVSKVGKDELNHTRLAGHNTLDDVIGKVEVETRKHLSCN